MCITLTLYIIASTEYYVRLLFTTLNFNMWELLCWVVVITIQLAKRLGGWTRFTIIYCEPKLTLSHKNDYIRKRNRLNHTKTCYIRKLTISYKKLINKRWLYHTKNDYIKPKLIISYKFRYTINHCQPGTLKFF